MPFRGWILFDADCPFCVRLVAAAKSVLAPRGFAFLPLQTSWVRNVFAIPEAQLLSEMRVLLPNRKSFGGADAIVEIAKRIWWTWPLVAFAHLPGARPALRAAYRAIAARRSCRNGACAIQRIATSTDSKTKQEARKSNSLLFLSGVLLTAMASVLVVAYFERPLFRILTDHCRSDDLAKFGIAFSNVTVVLTPILFAPRNRPDDSVPNAIFKLADQLQTALLGLVISVFVLARFITRPGVCAQPKRPQAATAQR